METSTTRSYGGNESRFDVPVDPNGPQYEEVVEFKTASPIKRYVLPIIGAACIVGIITAVLVLLPMQWDNTVIIISVDGFPARFFEDKDPDLYPNLAKMRQEGVSAEYLEPVFPSLTFPNHYSIVTGRYPADHGIVHNTMYDPETEEIFTFGTRDNYWWAAEPLWITAQKQGQKSGTMFWPGSDVDIDGMYPTYYKPYDGSFPYEKRVDKIIEWLNYPYQSRPTMLTLYFDEPDHAEHVFGPESPEVDPYIVKVDETLGYLFDRMEKEGYYDKVDVIVVSDHGHVSTPVDKIVYMEDYGLNFGRIFDINDPEFNTTGLDGWCVSCGAMATFIPFEGKEDEIYDVMSTIPGLLVYTNTSIQEERPDWNYIGNDRIPELIAVGDIEDGEAYMVFTNDCTPDVLGNHGYDNKAPEMQAIFVARGPHFRADGEETPPLSNLDIYQMAASILNLKPAENDGNLTIEDIASLYFS